VSVLGGLPCRRLGLHWPRQMPVAGQRLARTAMEDARCRRSATAATAWATALVPACCQATRGCASTIPRRGGRRASGCSWCGRADSGTASYGAGNRRSRMSCTACCVRLPLAPSTATAAVWFVPGGIIARWWLILSRLSRFGCMRGSPGRAPFTANTTVLLRQRTGRTRTAFTRLPP